MIKHYGNFLKVGAKKKIIYGVWMLGGRDKTSCGGVGEGRGGRGGCIGNKAKISDGLA